MTESIKGGCNIVRKLLAGVILTGLMVGSAAVGAWAATGNRQQIEVEYRDIKVTVNGKPVTMDAEPFLYLEKGRTFVPARPLAEALNATVGWNQDTGTVEVYTKTYLKVTTEGTYKLWSMPGQGFSIKTPKTFVEANTGTSIWQAALPDPATNTNAVAAVTLYEFSPVGPSQTLEQKLQAVMDGMTQTFLPGAKVAEIVPGKDMITANGTVVLFGRVPAAFSIRLVEGGPGQTWMLMALTPEHMVPAVGSTMQEILDSFTLTK